MHSARLDRRLVIYSTLLFAAISQLAAGNTLCVNPQQFARLLRENSISRERRIEQ